MKYMLILMSAFASLAASISNAEAPARFSDLPLNGEVQVFSVQGSNTIGAALGPELIRRYLEQKGAEDVTIEPTKVANEVIVSGRVPATLTRVYAKVAAHGSGTGFVGLADKSADIAAASRPIKDAEADTLHALGDMRAPESEHIIGIDGLAIIVNPNNPIAELSVDEIAQIFSGGYTDWSQVGGRPGPIHLYARDENSGTWDSFAGMVLGKRALLQGTRRFESSDELSAVVAEDINGIGFVGLSSVHKSRLLAVSDGSSKALKPNKLTVGTEDYALARRLFMYTNAKTENPYVNEFIDFVQDDMGQKVVAETGFVSQELQAVTPEFYAELPQDFRDLTVDAQRLTINFRFQEGSAHLDNKGLQDVERLVSYLQQKGQSEIVLIGFGDRKRSERRAELLSRLRAMAVRRELVRNGIYPKEAIGYGEQMPIASLDHEEGKQKNRRVEVWIRQPVAPGKNS